MPKFLGTARTYASHSECWLQQVEDKRPIVVNEHVVVNQLLITNYTKGIF
ncbi:hypothetical protein H6F61_22990 [Cyanobacteria bacterium FACHB-472]|nr:hypothetical protein [Cyanobacteria bacterium FACHB-472]